MRSGPENDIGNGEVNPLDALGEEIEASIEVSPRSDLGDEAMRQARFFRPKLAPDLGSLFMRSAGVRGAPLVMHRRKFN